MQKKNLINVAVVKYVTDLLNMLIVDITNGFYKNRGKVDAYLLRKYH